MVESGGRFALVGSFVEGPKLSDVMRARPWRTRRLLHGLAGIQAQLHRVAPPAATPARMPGPDRVKRYLKLLPDDIADLMAREVPAADAQGFCHGDFHGGNVLVSPRGMVVVDWDRAGQGPIAADVARTMAWLTLGPSDGRQLGAFELAIRRRLAESYLGCYCRLTGRPARPIRAWLMFEIIRRRWVHAKNPVLECHLERLAATFT